MILLEALQCLTAASEIGHVQASCQDVSRQDLFFSARKECTVHGMPFRNRLHEKTDQFRYHALFWRFHARLTHDLITDPGFEIVDSFHGPYAVSRIGINTMYGGGTSLLPRFDLQTWSLFEYDSLPEN